MSNSIAGVWVKAETKPPMNKCVLVFIPDEDYHITAGMWDVSEKWVLLDEYRKPESEVTHWMDCPDIPEEYRKERAEQYEVLKDFGKMLREGKIKKPDEMIAPKLDSNPLAFYSPKTEYPKAIPVNQDEKFQDKVFDWCIKCFGEEITHDTDERSHRFLEESLELVQAMGTTKSECQQLVDYVFGRNIGEINQELGGVMVTLAALSNAIGLRMDKAAETELQRIWGKIEKIREKQAAKPKHSPLPSPIPVQEGLVSKKEAIDFAAWTAENLYTTFRGVWYEYRDEDNTITGEQLYDLFLKKQSPVHPEKKEK